MSKNNQQNQSQKGTNDANEQSKQVEGASGIPPVVDAAGNSQSGAGQAASQSGNSAAGAQPSSAPQAVADAPVAKVVLAPASLSVTGHGLTGVPAGYINFIEDYCVTMNPKKPMSAAEAARHQLGLYRTLVNVLNNSGEQFTKVYATLLKLFQQHKDGALSTLAVYRAADMVALNAEERQTFHSLLDLLILTADPQSRKVALKQVDLGKTFRTKIINEQTKQRVLNFYNV